MNAKSIQNNLRPQFHESFALWPIASGITIALFLNYYLDEANLSHYDWLLYPIKILLELTQGVAYEATALGYKMPGSLIVVAPECAGLRFMGLCLIGGSLQIQKVNWPRLLLNFSLLMILAYGMTIFASFARILLWMQLEIFTDISTIASNMHAPLGLLVYLTFFIIAGFLWPRLQMELK